MGSYSPVQVDEEELVELIHRPVLRELASRGSPFIGTLYAGVMLTSDGPKVYEFNCRFGDPETQSILPRLDTDLLGALVAASRRDLSGTELATTEDAAVTVVLASGDYPAGGDRGSPIDGISDAESTGALVFHAGTALHGDVLVTNGGRILGVTALGATVAAARERAYAACKRISFPGMQYRMDIAGVAHVETASGDRRRLGIGPGTDASRAGRARGTRHSARVRGLLCAPAA